MTEEDVEALARELMDQHGLEDWTFSWNDNSRVAGRCYWHTQGIELSRVIMFDTPERNIRETILHEIAHALTSPTAGHYQDWHDKLIAIGGTGIWVTTDGRTLVMRPGP